ncbi:MAG: hypothetical protein LAP87_01650 [Acidobacteriia bacterium]|nr:hypothetical protein [Terriglobia bacterium]
MATNSHVNACRRAEPRRSPGIDLWTHKDQNIEGPAQMASVPAHGVVMWRVR